MVMTIPPINSDIEGVGAEADGSAMSYLYRKIQIPERERLKSEEGRESTHMEGHYKYDPPWENFGIPRQKGTASVKT